MKLSELALSSPGEGADLEEDAGSDSDILDGALGDFYDAMKDGNRESAIAELKGAIEAAIAASDD